jgi:hypothetical protein
MKNAAIYVRVSTPTSTSKVNFTIFESWLHSEDSRLHTNTPIVVFVERTHAVRVSMPSWRMHDGKSSPWCWWRHSTALQGALGIFYK